MKISGTEGLQPLVPGVGSSGLGPDATRGVPAASVRPEAAPAERRAPQGDGAERAAEEARRAASSFKGYHLSFRFDRDINRVVVRVIDSDSGTVIRSIPPEEAVRMLKQLRSERGTILDAEA